MIAIAHEQEHFLSIHLGKSVLIRRSVRSLACRAEVV